MDKVMVQEFNSESGMVTLEALPLIIVFLVLIAYSLGMYGITHSAILNSIASRNYAFETFRHRADLVYFRSNAGGEVMWYSEVGSRVHAIISENSESSEGQFPATVRKIAMGLDSAPEEVERTPATVHNADGGARSVYSVVPGKRNTTIDVRDVWVMTQYGICLDARCGDR